MKSLKKILSIFAAFMMVVGLTAANVKAGTATITITNAANGETYSAYKLFDVTKSATNADAVSYTATATQKTLFEGLAENPFVFTGSNGSQYSVSVGKKADGTTYTDAEVTSFLANNEETIFAGMKPTNATANSGEAKFENLDPGYYYIKSNGTNARLVMVGTTDITIQDKNDNGFTKTSDQTSGFAGVGDYVKFTVTGKLYKGLTKYEVKDTMTNLTFVNNTEAGQDTTKNLVVKYTDGSVIPKSSYTMTPVDTNGFTLSFNAAFLDTISTPTNIVVEYYGQVTKDAVTNNTATNKAELEYGNNDSTSKDEDTVTLYNYNLEVLKYDGADTTKATTLAGAEFQLYTGTEANKTLVNLVKDGNVWRLADASDSSYNNTVVTDATGKLIIKGLDKDAKYWLRETKAPDGFNLKEEDIEVNKTSIEAPDTLTVTQEIENNKGTVLPSTGGMGTTMIYIAGAILMVGAAIIFVTNKRMKHE